MSEQLIQEIHDRVAAMDTRVSEESIRGMIASYLDNLANDSDFGRKMRFGQSDPALIGTKFARWGLTVDDIEFAYDVLTSAKARGLSAGPSADLEAALVYPEHADDTAGRFSVDSALGTAILGCREGDAIDWRIRDRTCRVQIARMLYQPEAAGVFDL